jgi:hypothetical protein
MKMDLSAVNAPNCTVELKLIVDSAGLPEGVTDNAFYTLKLTNVDCENVCAHSNTSFRYVQNDMDTTDELYEEKYCEDCNEALEAPRKAFFKAHTDFVWVNGAPIGQISMDAIMKNKTYDMADSDVDITSIGWGAWAGAKATITGYQYRVLASDRTTVLQNWTIGNTQITDASDVLSVSAIARSINENATANGYASGICDARYIQRLTMDLSAIDANNVIVELKLTVDLAGLPKDVTDNAFYVLKITNVDCCNHTSCSYENLENGTHKVVCDKCGVVQKIENHNWTAAVYNGEKGGYVYSCACEVEAVQKTASKIDLFLDAVTLYNKSTVYTPELHVEDGETYVTLTDPAGDSYFTVYNNGTATTGNYFVLKYRLDNIDDIADPLYGNIYSSTVASEKSDTVTCAPINYIADGKWHVIVFNFAFYDNNFKADGSGAGNGQFVADGSNNYIAKFLGIDACPGTDGSKIDIAYAGFCSDLSQAVSFDEDYEYWGLEGDALKNAFGGNAVLSDEADPAIGMNYITYSPTIVAGGEKTVQLTSSNYTTTNVGSVIAVLYKKPAATGVIRFWRNSKSTGAMYWDGSKKDKTYSGTYTWDFDEGTVNSALAKSTKWEVIYFRYERADFPKVNDPTYAAWMRFDMSNYKTSGEQRIDIAAIKSFGSLAEAQAWGEAVLSE